MKTLFYKRTAYESLNRQVPKCFIELDDYFGKTFKAGSEIFQSSTRLAENLCHRMADVELYADYISEEVKRDNAFKAAINIGTLLVGFFTSCKSVLDAGAMALNMVYKLNLPERQQDFGKPELMRELKKKTRTEVYKRYRIYDSFIKEAIGWRDSAVHRHTPFCIVHQNHSNSPREQQEIKLANQLDADINDIARKSATIEWVEPLHQYNKWYSSLVAFCADVCTDIQSHAFEDTFDIKSTPVHRI